MASFAVRHPTLLARCRQLGFSESPVTRVKHGRTVREGTRFYFVSQKEAKRALGEMFSSFPVYLEERPCGCCGFMKRYILGGPDAK